MQPRRSVLLDHEPPPLRRRYLDLAARLRGFFKIPLFSIGGEVSRGHDQSRAKKTIGAVARQQAPGIHNREHRSPDGAKRNPGTVVTPAPDFAALDPGYGFKQRQTRLHDLAAQIHASFACEPLPPDIRGRRECRALDAPAAARVV